MDMIKRLEVLSNVEVLAGRPKGSKNKPKIPGPGHNNPPKEIKEWKKPIKFQKIENKTPILPHVIAEEVTNRAAQYLKHKAPIAYKDHLTEKADKLFNNNEIFHKKMKAKGDKGRDHLYMYMRHWLSAKLKKEHPHLHAKLPSGFSNGQDI